VIISAGPCWTRGAEALRILYFSLGDTVHDRRFLQRIADFGYEVWSLRLSDAGRADPDEDTSGAGPRASWPTGAPTVKGPEGVPNLLPAFRDVLADVRPAVVHAGPTQSCGYLAALSEFHPFLLMSWGSDLLVDAERNEVWRRATSVALHGSDLLLCDSAAVRTKAHTLLGYDDSRIVQFPWGVDLKEFRPGADDRGLRHEMGWDDSFIILSTRSWEPLYGIETLLEAFRRAYAKEPRMRLILLGGGSLASKIERFLKSNKLDRFVHRPGVMPHDAISAYFRAVDLYVSCSLSDGSSVSLLEAMATGLPVVVSDTPGNREWVVSGKNGWLAPVGDADAFAGHLITSIRSGSSARARISQANRGIAERRADWSRNSEQLRQAYERLAGA